MSYDNFPQKDDSRNGNGSGGALVQLVQWY